LNRNNQELNIGDNVRLKIIRTIFEKGSDARFTKNIHKILAINRDGSFKVNDRTRNYKRNELLKVNTEQLQTNPNQDNYEISQQMIKKHKADRRINRRLNKEGLDQKNIIEDNNERTLRKYRNTRGINLSHYL